MEEEGMAKCPKQQRKKRQGKPHQKKGGGGSKNDYRRPYKGHQWVGKGMDRKCELCGKVPDCVKYDTKRKVKK